MTLVTRETLLRYVHYVSVSNYLESGYVYQDGTTIFDYEVVMANTVAYDVGQRNWKDLIRNGQCATTGLTGLDRKLETSELISNTKRTMTIPFQEVEVQHINQRESFIDGGFAFPGSFPEAELQASNQAASNFYTRLQSEETKFKGLVFLGELRESLSMIRHPVRSFRNSIDDYFGALKKKGPRYKRRRDRENFVRDTWLEYSYGWSPLISDIDSGIKAFYDSKLVRPILKMVRGRGIATVPISKTSGMKYMGFGQVDYVIEETAELACKYYGVLRYSGSGDSNSHVAGFRPNEFIPTLWELIPYSFLVDYFTNIGDILESWSYGSCGITWCSKGTCNKAIREVTNVNYTLFEDIPDLYKHENTAFSPGKYRSETKEILRIPDIGAPSVGFQLRLPGDWSKWTNISALAHSFYSARKALNN